MSNFNWKDEMDWIYEQEKIKYNKKEMEHRLAVRVLDRYNAIEYGYNENE